MNRSIFAVVGALAVFLGLFTVHAERPLAQTGKWISHVDPSLLTEIILRDGELYLSTSGGLVIFELSDSTFEQHTNVSGLPSNFLTCLTFDANGSLYVGTEDSGVARLDFTPGGFDVTPLTATFHGLTSDRILTLTTWGDTIVYGTDAGAGLILSGVPGARFTKKNGMPGDRVNDLFADVDRVWMATDSGVVFLDRFGFINEFSGGLPSLNSRSLARTDTALWVGTASGVARFNSATSTWISEGLGGEDVFSLRFDGDKLWAGTRGRIYENDGSGWISHGIFEMHAKYDLNSALTEIRGLQPMPDGSVFVGMGDPLAERRGANLMIFDGASIRDIPFNSLPMNVVLRLSTESNGAIWLSSANFGVGKLTPAGEWFNYNKAAGDDNLSNRFFNLAFVADSKGSKWFGGFSLPGSPVPMDELQDEGDLDRGNDVWIKHNIDSGGGEGLGSLRNLKAKEDPAGNLWFLSDDFSAPQGWWGINILSADRTEWRQVNPTSTDGAMEGGNIFDVAFAEDGVAYVALFGLGVQRWRTGGFDKENLFDLTNDSWFTIGRVGNQFDANADMLSLAVRPSDGVLWIGTTAGLYRYDGFFRHIPAKRGIGVGLLGNIVDDLIIDRNEDLWVATDLGLNGIPKDDINDIVSFTTPVVWQTQLSLYFQEDVVSPIVNANCNALALHPTKDLLYIGTDGGLSVLDIVSLSPQGTDLSSVYVYPNPIRARQGHTALKIHNINSSVFVEIFTIDGELVASTEVANSGDEVWDLKTATPLSGSANNQLAASGVYLVRINDGNGTIIKKVALIR